MSLDDLAEEYASRTYERWLGSFESHAWKTHCDAYRAGFLAAKELCEKAVGSVRVCGRGSTTDEPDTILWQIGREKCLELIRKIGEEK